MKKLFSFLAAIVISIAAMAQVTTVPAIVQKDYKGNIKIIFNPAEGNKGMVGATQCYAHTGVITNKSAGAWTHVQNEWRDSSPKTQMTKNGSNWELNIDNMYTFYNCPESEVIEQLCFVFNDGKGGEKEGKTADGGDIFVVLADAGLAASLNGSTGGIISVGTAITVTANATMEADMELKLNGSVVKSGKGMELTYSTTASTAGDYNFTLTATAGTETATATWSTCAPSAATLATRPAGLESGITYYNGNDTKVTLCTYAASKTQPAQHVFVVGDFNNWSISNTYQMKRDGNYFWLDINGLEAGKEYAFQYVVMRADSVTKYISDLYSEKLLHPDDKYEPKTLNPNLKDYPEKGKGYVTVIETGRKPYAWSEATLNFRRPDKNNLIIYETWVYDFTPFHSFQALLDRIDYIANLGVNALELMPVCEFDGNVNWGYSPNHYFAVDKVYGSGDELKKLIDECHKRGIAVILDMVFNHGTGLNPMNALYPYGTDLANNPWFNVKAPHPDNVYEDWNHDFGPAHEMFIRALKYWLTEYKVDGYRLDLSHGLCGPSYNAVSNLKDYYEKGVKAVSSDAYMILEHWGEHMGTDRPQLVNAGMMCWQNTSNAYCQTAMGWLKDGDSFADANMDNYVSCCETHDEERCFFKAKQWGDGNMKEDENVRAGRVPLNMAFLVMLNGPHIFYHFAELGFDYSKYQNKWGQWGKTNPYDIKGGTLTDDPDMIKMQPKARPEHWMQENGARMQAYQKTAKIIRLRTQLLPKVFEGNPTASTISGGKQIRSVQWGSDVYVVGNFSASKTGDIALPSGTWYDYLDGGKAATNYTLAPGEVKVFTGSDIKAPEVPGSYDFEAGFFGIQSDETNKAIQKYIRNGMLIIERDGVRYDVMGRRF